MSALGDFLYVLEGLLDTGLYVVFGVGYVEESEGFELVLADALLHVDEFALFQEFGALFLNFLFVVDFARIHKIPRIQFELSRLVGNDKDVGFEVFQPPAGERQLTTLDVHRD